MRNSKICQEDADKIRKFGKSIKTQAWASKLGITTNAIQKILRNERWVAIPR